MPKISQYPAQTGASVANGDLIPIVDVGSPNVTERITVDELAQAPQFSSRYAPVPDRVWLPATDFNTAAGSPTLGVEPAGHWNPAWLLDASTIELVSTTQLVPQGWNTYDIFLWWSNAGAGAGNVVLNVNDWTVTTTGAFVAAYAQTVTAVARDTIVHTKMNTTAITRVADVKMFTMRRNGNDAADTLANDIGVNGLMLVKVS